VVGDSIYYLFLFLYPESSRRALPICSLAQLTMPLAVQAPLFTPLEQLPASARRGLHRRSSCPSIPRSVSVCSSVLTFDSSSEDLRNPGDDIEADIFMSPLFRGHRESREASEEAVEEVSDSDTPIEDFTPRSKAIHYDNRLSENLSNYHFDITGHVPESPKASEGNPEEQSPTPTHLTSPLVLNKRSNAEASHPLPPPRHSSPTLEDPPPPVPPRKTRQMVPPNTGTRPLQIGRSKKRQESSGTPQWLSRADVQYDSEPPFAKPILRTATQVDLHGAYRGASPLADRKVRARGVTPVMPSSRPKIPSPNATEVLR